jgi:hypothetical protein
MPQRTHCVWNIKTNLFILFRDKFAVYCKVKFTLEQATKAQRGSGVIALLFL